MNNPWPHLNTHESHSDPGPGVGSGVSPGVGSGVSIIVGASVGGHGPHSPASASMARWTSSGSNMH